MQRGTIRGMKPHRPLPLIFFALCLFSIWVRPSGAAAPGADIARGWGEAAILFTGKLETAQAGPVAKSMPPIYSHTLVFTVKEVLRGNLNAGEKVTGSHSARQINPPKFPVGELCLVSAEHSRGRLVIKKVVKEDSVDLKVVRQSASVPLGWVARDGKLFSPWAGIKGAGWKGEALAGVPACAVTGRPAFLCGDGIAFSAEPVPPEKAIKWTNPDGDGLYKITVKNDSAESREVAALLQMDGKVLWKESLVILCQDKAHPVPGATGRLVGAAPLKLGPGKSVEGVVNVFQLRGIEWPRGGYRIAFQFCLGEKSETESFYYMSRHHDAIRKRAVEAMGE